MSTTTPLSRPAGYPLRLDGRFDTTTSRWLWLVKWLLVLPHAIVLFFLWLAAILVTHNLAAIARTAERVVYLQDGHLAAWGLPHELMGRQSLEALHSNHGGEPGVQGEPARFADED